LTPFLTEVAAVRPGGFEPPTNSFASPPPRPFFSLGGRRFGGRRSALYGYLKDGGATLLERKEAWCITRAGTGPDLINQPELTFEPTKRFTGLAIRDVGAFDQKRVNPSRTRHDHYRWHSTDAWPKPIVARVLGAVGDRRNGVLGRPISRTAAVQVECDRSPILVACNESEAVPAGLAFRHANAGCMVGRLVHPQRRR